MKSLLCKNPNLTNPKNQNVKLRLENWHLEIGFSPAFINPVKFYL